jgi:hypothetical protein
VKDGRGVARSFIEPELEILGKKTIRHAIQLCHPAFHRRLARRLNEVDHGRGPRAEARMFKGERPQHLPNEPALKGYPDEEDLSG